MAEGVNITPGSGASIAADLIGSDYYQRMKVCYGSDGFAIDVSGAAPLPVILYNASIPVTGAFWQAEQPVSIAATVNVAGPLTDSQLRASAVPVSVASVPTHAVTQSGTWNVTVSNASIPVTGTFWQTTQPVSIASMPSTPVTGTFWQTTQPVSVASTLATRDLKDVSRTSIALTAEFAFAQTAETLLTMTLSSDGAATSTFTSRTVTSAKTYRIQQVIMEVEGLGSGAAPQRAYLRLRRNNAGATIASSPLQAVWACCNNPAVVKTGTVQAFDVPDGLEITGDGTKTFGFTLETPDWVTTTATGRAKITVIGFEY
jgi:hypothetical protein